MTQIIFLTSLLAVWQNPTPVYVGPGDQTIDVVISDGEGGAAVIWWDDVTEWNYMQVIDSAGNLKWDAEGVPIIATAGLSTQNPDVFQDDDGNYWVALEGNEDIYVQKLSPTGQRLFGDDGVAVCTAVEKQSRVHLCSSFDGVIVAWNDMRTSPSHSYTQRLDQNGQMKWAVDGILVAEPDYSSSAKPISDEHEGAYYIFRSVLGEENHIAGQRIDSLGIRQWGDSGIVFVKGTVGWTYSNIPGHMAADDDGGFIFFYADGGYYRANRVDNLGNLLWDTSSVLLGSASQNSNGTVSPLTPQGFYIARGFADFSIEAVYAHKLTLDGETPWNDTGVSVWNVWAYDPDDPYAAYVNENGTIAWRDVYDEGDPYGDRYEEQGIMAQRIDQNGNIIWPKEILVCGTSGSNPKTVSTFNQSSIMVWQDIRNASSDIYAAQVDSTGNIAGIEEQPIQLPPSPLQVQLVGSNPVVKSAHLMFSIEKGAFVQANVYDASGRRVTVLTSGYVNPGTHQLVWNGGDELRARCASGVYFIRVSALGTAVYTATL